MQLDTTAYIRALARSGSLGTSASGAAFATSTGDMLEVACFGPGVFRLRVGANTRPDYGLVVGRAQRCDIAQPEPGVWTFAAGGTRLELTGEPLRFRLLHDEQPIVTSITDEHFRGFPRLPVIGRARTGQQWIAAFALASGEPVYGLGEKFGPLNKRGQLVTSRVDDALGVNTGLSYKSVPFCWSPGNGAAKGGAWGVFVNTPGRVTHGVGYPEWSHRSYALLVDDEALDLFLIAGRDPAQVLDRYTMLTGRAPDVPLWSLGLWVSRAYYRTADEAMAVAEELRSRKIPCDVLALDGRAVWEVRTRFDFRWDATRYPDPAATLARMKRHSLRICVWEYPYVSIHSPLFAELAAKRFLLTTDDRRALRVRLGYLAGDLAVFRRAHAAARIRHRRFHQSRRLRLVARRPRAAVQGRRRRDQERLRRARSRRRRRVQRRPRRAPAQRLSVALQPLRLRGDEAVRTGDNAAADRLEPRRLDRQPALSRSSGAATRRATGKASPRASAADCRGA